MRSRLPQKRKKDRAPSSAKRCWCRRPFFIGSRGTLRAPRTSDAQIIPHQSLARPHPPLNLYSKQNDGRREKPDNSQKPPSLLKSWNNDLSLSLSTVCSCHCHIHIYIRRTALLWHRLKISRFLARCIINHAHNGLTHSLSTAFGLAQISISHLVSARDRQKTGSSQGFYQVCAPSSITRRRTFAQNARTPAAHTHGDVTCACVYAPFSH